jgi:hypothetical protein
MKISVLVFSFLLMDDNEEIAILFLTFVHLSVIAALGFTLLRSVLFWTYSSSGLDTLLSSQFLLVCRSFRLAFWVHQSSELAAPLGLLLL